MNLLLKISYLTLILFVVNGARASELIRFTPRVYKTLSEALEDYNKQYLSSRRLEERVYRTSQGWALPYQGASILFPEQIIESMANHCRFALENGYADFISYADMGHVHIYVPVGNEESVEKSLSRKDLKFLYHTAELFELKKNSLPSGKLTEDPWLRWRYYSRNLLGTLDSSSGLKILFAKDQAYNTVRQLKGHKEILTLYFRANHQADFAFEANNKDFYFDISAKNQL